MLGKCRFRFVHGLPDRSEGSVQLRAPLHTASPPERLANRRARVRFQGFRKEKEQRSVPNNHMCWRLESVRSETFSCLFSHVALSFRRRTPRTGLVIEKPI